MPSGISSWRGVKPVQIYHQKNLRGSLKCLVIKQMFCFWKKSIEYIVCLNFVYASTYQHSKGYNISYFLTSDSEWCHLGQLKSFEISDSHRTFTQHMCSFEVSTEPADGPALSGSGPSAGTVITKFDSRTYIYIHIHSNSISRVNINTIYERHLILDSMTSKDTPPSCKHFPTIYRHIN